MLIKSRKQNRKLIDPKTDFLKKINKIDKSLAKPLKTKEHNLSSLGMKRN